MRVAVDGGAELRVLQRGADDPGGLPPVLLLHGFTGSVEAWGEGLLERLAAERRIVALDLPGHGESGLPEREGGLALPAVVRDLTLVLDRAGAERAVWVGYSMGGRIALGAAVLAPERVAALVLEGASPGLESAEERAERRALDETRAEALEAQGLEAWVDEWMALPLFQSRRALPPRVRAGERTRRLRNSVRGLARTLRELGTGSQPSFWGDLARIDVPVLLLTGERDPKFGRIADEMARRLPRARRVTVPGAGHTVHLEAPDAWLGAVAPFLARLDDRRADRAPLDDRHAERGRVDDHHADRACLDDRRTDRAPERGGKGAGEGEEARSGARERRGGRPS